MSQFPHLQNEDDFISIELLQELNELVYRNTQDSTWPHSEHNTSIPLVLLEGFKQAGLMIKLILKVIKESSDFPMKDNLK